MKLLDIEIDCALDDVLFGGVALRGANPEATDGFDAELEASIAQAKLRLEWPERTQPVRQLLRHGRYKPTGRGKPASEYLLRAATQDKFPRVFPLVDICNLVSLRCLLPISLIDLKRAETSQFVLRRGHEGERYVFNSVGQDIELTDLLLVAKKVDDQACANPVKDSMATKLSPEARDALAIIYAPPELRSALEEATAALTDRLAHYTRPQDIQHAVAP